MWDRWSVCGHSALMRWSSSAMWQYLIVHVFGECKCKRIIIGDERELIVSACVCFSLFFFSTKPMLWPTVQVHFICHLHRYRKQTRWSSCVRFFSVIPFFMLMVQLTVCNGKGDKPTGNYHLALQFLSVLCGASTSFSSSFWFYGLPYFFFWFFFTALIKFLVYSGNRQLFIVKKHW